MEDLIRNKIVFITSALSSLDHQTLVFAPRSKNQRAKLSLSNIKSHSNKENSETGSLA
jgi:hypothetical protein